ncbi:hypothetical protein T11_10776 [Trichinella zimbabwensis]|uniref:Uncharacterized protein n=1 Tax=Trichinella zimbabwensis TaxID=268475 RepID=A0A0V1GIS6_9BILA|nr:hypothetical protein T11_10776 [Trichinella zimbabwensis]
MSKINVKPLPFMSEIYIQVPGLRCKIRLPHEG